MLSKVRQTPRVSSTSFSSVTSKHAPPTSQDNYSRLLLQHDLTTPQHLGAGVYLFFQSQPRFDGWQFPHREA